MDRVNALRQNFLLGKSLVPWRTESLGFCGWLEPLSRLKLMEKLSPKA
jgi:hypothetical protein